MGLIDNLKKIFGSKSAIESRFKSDLNQNSINSSDSISDSSDSNRDLNQQSAEIQGSTDFTPKEEPGLFYQPLPNMISPNQQASTPRAPETRPMQQPTMLPKRQLSSLPQMPALAEPVARQPTIELQKDSLELGMAAGYAGRSLKEIETSLNRIETFMASKEWFTNQFGPQLHAIYDSIHVHDENTIRKLEMIEFMIQSLEKTAKRAPEPLKTELLNQIETLESQIRTPTRKMQKLVEIVKSRGELSYSELAAGLEISESALRGLLSNTVRRTKNITRVSRDGKGFVRYIGGENADLNQPHADLNRSHGDSSAVGF
ncbi:MAG: hypothetical protein NT016_00340 [Candidatus Aenigmarchaeota archaeon]|nr:hypothetical protein [Candidatus Aenigmarchaeota archaeon]